MTEELAALQQELRAVQGERNKLQQKVEAMCKGRGAHMFSSSYVLSERVQAIESELRQLQVDLSCTKSERDSLKEDMMQLRNAKRLSDMGWRDEKLHSQDLERKLASAAAEEQEEHAFDASLLRRRVERLEASLQEARVQTVAEQQQRHDLEVQLATAKQQLACTEVELQRERAAAERMQQDSNKAAEKEPPSGMQVRPMGQFRVRCGTADLADARFQSKNTCKPWIPIYLVSETLLCERPQTWDRVPSAGWQKIDVQI